MFGLESVGPGHDVRVEGAGVPEFETPLGAPAAELAAQAWRGQVDEPRDDKLAELSTWVDGLPAKLRDSFLGEAVAGFEEVSNGIRDGLVQGFADAIRDAENLGARLAPIRDAARALIRPVEDRVAQVEESQLSAEEQLALLEGVRGYCSAHQARNVGGAGSQGPWALPFSAPVGAAKGARVLPDGSIEFLETGLWMVSVLATGRATIATPGFGSISDNTELTIAVQVPGQSARTVKTITGAGGQAQVSITATFPMVVTKVGTRISAAAGSSRWRYWDGGTNFSGLSVVKHDNRTDNPGQETVPNG